MRSSSTTLQTHYFKKDVDLMQDEQNQNHNNSKKLTKTNKNVVETPLKQIKNKIVVDKKTIKKKLNRLKLKF
jgi:hypothetical protein